MPDASKRLQEISKLIAVCLCILVLAEAFICLSGWISENSELKAVFLGRQMIMRSSVAIALIALSLSVALNAIFEQEGKQTGKILTAPLLLPVLFGSTATFIESVSAADFSLSWTIFSPSENSSGVTFPGPMPPNVSLNFIVLTLSILFSNFLSARWQWIWLGLLITSFALSLTAFFGFLCGVDSLCTMFGCVRMPCTISISLSFLALAQFCMHPESELCKIFVAESLGGKIARRFLTFALAIPACFTLRWVGTATGLFDQAFGWAVFGVLVFASLIAVVIWSARTLDVVDTARIKAEEKHEEAEKEKESIERKLVSEVAKQVVRDSFTSRAIEPANLRNLCLTCTKEYQQELEYCPDDGTMLIQLPNDSVIGTAFADKYYIIEELGKGGMSTVYKARHLFLEHQILAVKVLQSHLAKDTTSIKRFQHEARTASRLEHPNLLKIHDFGVTRQGQPYLLMEFIKGKSLRELLAECKRLDLSRFEELIGQTIKGIAFAHKNGVVHRDLKPGNIMIIEKEDGEELVKIVDFGLAKGIQNTDVQLSKTGEIFGSPLYMSPEQWGGKRVDARSDIYALGCIMYECLMGTPPFDKSSMMELLQAHVYEQVQTFPKSLRIPEHIQHTVFSCLAKTPEERPKDSETLLAMLRFTK